MVLNKNMLHQWEEKYKHLCFVNMQKNLPVYNLKTREDDFIFKGVRTTIGYFDKESKTHIKIIVKDAKDNYSYLIKKKLINGMKEYYE